MSFSLFGEGSSLNTLLILAGVGLIGYFVWKLFTAGSNSNPASFSTKFSNLPDTYQALLNFLFGVVSGQSIPIQYNSAIINFTLAQIPSGNDFQGLVLSSSDGSINIYITYYEYANWNYATIDEDHVATLSVPTRTLSNGVITDNATGGYSLTGTLPNVTINSLTGNILPGVINSAGIPVSIATLPTLPSMPGH